jgi:hypothetical protein
VTNHEGKILSLKIMMLVVKKKKKKTAAAEQVGSESIW